MLRYRFISATLLVVAVAGILLLTPWAGVAGTRQSAPNAR